MRFQLGQTVFLAVPNTPLDAKGLPKRVQKLLHLKIQSHSWRQARKGRVRPSPGEPSTVGSASGVQPTFLRPRHAPTRWLPSQVLRTQSKTNKKAVAVPRRERIITSGYFKVNLQVTVLRSNSYICFLPASMNFQRKELCKILPSSLNWVSQRYRKADPGKTFHPLSGLERVGCLSRSSPSHQKPWSRRSDFLLYFLSWILGYDAFFSRTLL